MRSKRRDFTQTALDVVRQATGEVTAPATSKKQESGRKAKMAPKRAKSKNASL